MLCAVLVVLLACSAGHVSACPFLSDRGRRGLAATPVGHPAVAPRTGNSTTMAALRAIAARRRGLNNTAVNFELIREEIRYILESAAGVAAIFLSTVLGSLS